VEIYNTIFFIFSVTSNLGNFLTLKTIVMGETLPETIVFKLGILP
jgi:hypothetical protein